MQNHFIKINLLITIERGMLLPSACIKTDRPSSPPILAFNEECQNAVSGMNKP
jgi:hypothetical protein